MSNLLHKGQALLLRLMPGAAAPAGAVTYRRAAGGPAIDLTGKCWVGGTVYGRVPDEGGVVVRSAERDYLVPAADLPCVPKRGDRVTEVINGSPVTFEVAEPYGEPEARFADPGRTVHRIHVKQVG